MSRWLAALTGLLLLLQAGAISAHPEDEFCGPGSGLDTALCAALSEADRPADLYPSREAAFDMVRDRPLSATLVLYTKLGFEHILPKGLDHILFVLALFLASTRLRPLLIQVSAFTLAHTLTLGLAATGWVRAPADLVEPLIAASIAWVAAENLMFTGMTRWRPAVVFGFGLFHGLGFASVLLELGLPENQLLPALLAFNVGVELGQLAVILAAWILLHRWFTKPWYRRRVVQPASLAIAITGGWWAIERVFPGG